MSVTTASVARASAAFGFYLTRKDTQSIFYAQFCALVPEVNTGWLSRSVTLNRRFFLTGLAATAFVSGRLSFASSFRENTLIPLWNSTPPGGGGPVGQMHVSASGAQSNISVPTLTVINPVRPNGRAVLIAGGGGYKRIEAGKESLPAAAWLTARGYTSYILSYRLPDEGWHDGKLVALQDAQRALRIVREREKEVSVLGFSAGGHLMGMLALRPGFESYAPTDGIDQIPAKADSAALIYPVITLEKPYTHTSVHKIFAGAHASSAAEAEWSVQNYVTPSAPAFFLVQAKDDPVSDPANTLIMFSACEAKHVPVALHRYSSGGHGFGMGRPGTPTEEWPKRYEKWLAEH